MRFLRIQIIQLYQKHRQYLGIKTSHPFRTVRRLQYIPRTRPTMEGGVNSILSLHRLYGFFTSDSDRFVTLHPLFASFDVRVISRFVYSQKLMHQNFPKLSRLAEAAMLAWKSEKNFRLSQYWNIDQLRVYRVRSALLSKCFVIKKPITVADFLQYHCPQPCTTAMLISSPPSHTL
jgi:hypothetical protein